MHRHVMFCLIVLERVKYKDEYDGRLVIAESYYICYNMILISHLRAQQHRLLYHVTFDSTNFANVYL